MNPKTYDKDQIFKRILSKKAQLLFFGVKKIGLFGSFIRGDQTSDSDMDILVEFTPEKHTFDNFMDVGFYWKKSLDVRLIWLPQSLLVHI